MDEVRGGGRLAARAFGWRSVRDGRPNASGRESKCLARCLSKALLWCSCKKSFGKGATAEDSRSILATTGQALPHGFRTPRDRTWARPEDSVSAASIVPARAAGQNVCAP